MVHDIVNDDSAVGLLQTTDNAFHKIVEYNMGSYPLSVATFVAR